MSYHVTLIGAEGVVAEFYAPTWRKMWLWPDRRGLFAFKIADFVPPYLPNNREFALPVQISAREVCYFEVDDKLRKR